jgi:hypothetical protein
LRISAVRRLVNHGKTAMIIYVFVERKSRPAAAEDYGHNVGAMGLEVLDRYVDGLDVTPLAALMDVDVETLEQAIQVAQPAEKLPMERQLEEARQRPAWHDPQEGLKTVRAILERLPQDERHEGVLADLRRFEAVLTDAADAGDLFRLNVRTAD